VHDVIVKSLLDTEHGQDLHDVIVKSLLDTEYGQYLRKTFDILWTFDMKLNPKKCVFGVRSGKFL